MTLIFVAGAAVILWTAVGLICHDHNENGDPR